MLIYIYIYELKRNVPISIDNNIYSPRLLLVITWAYSEHVSN